MFNLVLRDSDFGLECTELDNPRKRFGARGLVFNEKGQIAVFNKRNKNEFKLPGGGIDDGEDPEKAFIREVMEETGCTIENCEMMGVVEERQSRENFMQKSYVFKSNVKTNTGKLNLTQKEKDEGAVLHWLTPLETLQKLKLCINELKESKYDNVYRSKFMVKRDILILEEYLKMKEIL